MPSKRHCTLFPATALRAAPPDLAGIAAGWGNAINTAQDAAQHAAQASFFPQRANRTPLQPQCTVDIQLPSSWIVPDSNNPLTPPNVLNENLDLGLFRYLMSYSYLPISELIANKNSFLATLSFFLVQGDPRLFSPAVTRTIAQRKDEILRLNPAINRATRSSTTSNALGPDSSSFASTTPFYFDTESNPNNTGIPTTETATLEPSQSIPSQPQQRRKRVTRSNSSSISNAPNGRRLPLSSISDDTGFVNDESQVTSSASVVGNPTTLHPLSMNVENDQDTDDENDYQSINSQEDEVMKDANDDPLKQLVAEIADNDDNDDNDDDEDDTLGDEYIGRVGFPCGHVFRNGEYIYRCVQCGADETCVICSTCFDASAHEGHDISLTISSGSGGCCDCGDKEAWKVPLHCKYHNPAPGTTTNTEDHDAVPLPAELITHIFRTFSTILEFVHATYLESPEHPSNYCLTHSYRTPYTLSVQKDVYETPSEENFYPKPSVDDTGDSDDDDDSENEMDSSSFDDSNADRVTNDPEGALREYVNSKMESSTRNITAYPSYTLSNELRPDPDAHLRTQKPLKFQEDSYAVVLWNDEVHSFDDVITVVIEALDVDAHDAELVAVDVDKHGRNIVAYGIPFKRACKIAKIITSTALFCTVRSTRETNREVLSAYLLEWLAFAQTLFSQTPIKIGDVTYRSIRNAMREQLSNALLSDMLYAKRSLLGYNRKHARAYAAYTVDREDAKTRVEHLMLCDGAVWKDVRSLIKELLISTLVVSGDGIRYKFGKVFAGRFVDYAYNYVIRNTDPNNSTINLSVQVFTVPLIARDVMESMDTFVDILMLLKLYHLQDSTNDVDKFPCLLRDKIEEMRERYYRYPPIPERAESIANHRTWDLFSALMFLLSNSSIPLRNSQLASICDFFAVCQFMFVEKRAVITHVAYDTTYWSEGFNYAARISRFISEVVDNSEPLSLIKNSLEGLVAWALLESDVEMTTDAHRSRISFFVKEDKPVSSNQDILLDWFYGCRFAIQDLNSERFETTFKVSPSRVDTQVQSFHLPLHWFFSQAMQKFGDQFPYVRLSKLYMDFMPDIEENVLHKSTNADLSHVLLKIAEHPIRSSVWLSQIRSGIWVRNGDSVRLQSLHYSTFALREVYDHDRFLIQICAAMVENKNEFLLLLAQRFQLYKWFCGDWSMTDKYDTSNITCWAEDFFALIITILNERQVVSRLDEDALLEREVVHKLADAPLRFSHLSKSISMQNVAIRTLEQVVSKVANFIPPDNISGIGKYELKSAFLSKVDPYYFHLSHRGRRLIRELLAEKNMETIPHLPLPELLPAYKDLDNVVYCGMFSKLILVGLWNCFMTREFADIVLSIIKLLKIVLDISTRPLNNVDGAHTPRMIWKFVEMASDLVVTLSSQQLDSRAQVKSFVPGKTCNIPSKIPHSYIYDGIISEDRAPPQPSLEDILAESLTSGKWTLFRFLIAILETKPHRGVDVSNKLGLYSMDDENIDTGVEREIEGYREQIFNIMSKIADVTRADLDYVSNSMDNATSDGGSHNIVLSDGTSYPIARCKLWMAEIEQYLAHVKLAAASSESAQANDSTADADALTEAQRMQRKELAQRRKAEIMAKFASDQAQFVSKNKDELGIEDSTDEEDLDIDDDDNKHANEMDVDTSDYNVASNESDLFGISSASITHLDILEVDGDQKPNEVYKNAEQEWEYPSGMCIVCKEETNSSTEVYCLLGLSQPSVIVKNMDFDNKPTMSATAASANSKVSSPSTNTSLSKQKSGGSIIRHFGNILRNCSGTLDVSMPITENKEEMTKKKYMSINNVSSGPYVPSSTKPTVYTSTCGHIMHYTCFRQYFDSMTESDEAMFDKSEKEYLCPLCKSLGNCLIPVLWNSRKERISFAGAAKFDEDTGAIELPVDYALATSSLGNWWMTNASDSLLTLRDRQRRFRKRKSQRIRQRPGSVSGSMRSRSMMMGSALYRNQSFGSSYGFRAMGSDNNAETAGYPLRNASDMFSNAGSMGAFESVFDDDESRILNVDDESGGEGFDEIINESSDAGTILSHAADRKHPLMVKGYISKLYRSMISRPLQTITFESSSSDSNIKKSDIFIERWAPNVKRALRSKYTSRSYAEILKKVKKIPQSRVQVYSIHQLRRIYSMWQLWTLRAVKRGSPDDFDDSDSNIAHLDTLWESLGSTLEVLETSTRNNGISQLAFEQKAMAIEDEALESKGKYIYPYVGIIDCLKEDQRSLLRVMSANVTTFASLVTCAPDIEIQLRNRCINFSRMLFYGLMNDDRCCKINSMCPNLCSNLPSSKAHNSVDECYSCVPNLTPILSMDSIAVAIEVFYGLSPLVLDGNTYSDALSWAAILYLMQVVKSIVAIVDGVCFDGSANLSEFSSISQQLKVHEKDGKDGNSAIKLLEEAWAKQTAAIRSQLSDLKKRGYSSDVVSDSDSLRFDPETQSQIKGFISMILTSLGVCNEEFIYQLLNNDMSPLSNMELVFSLVEAMTLPFMRTIMLLLYAKCGYVPYMTKPGEEWLTKDDNADTLKNVSWETRRTANERSQKLFSGYGTELQRLLMAMKLPTLLDVMTMNCFDESYLDHSETSLHSSAAFSLNLMQGWLFHLGGIFKVHLQQWQISLPAVMRIVADLSTSNPETICKLPLSVYDYFHVFRKCSLGNSSIPQSHSNISLAALTGYKSRNKGKSHQAEANTAYKTLAHAQFYITDSPASPSMGHSVPPLAHQHCACQQSVFAPTGGFASINDRSRPEFDEPFRHFGNTTKANTAPTPQTLLPIVPADSSAINTNAADIIFRGRPRVSAISNMRAVGGNATFAANAPTIGAHAVNHAVDAVTGIAAFNEIDFSAIDPEATEADEREATRLLATRTYQNVVDGLALRLTINLSIVYSGRHNVYNGRPGAFNEFIAQLLAMQGIYGSDPLLEIDQTVIDMVLASLSSPTIIMTWLQQFVSVLRRYYDFEDEYEGDGPLVHSTLLPQLMGAIPTTENENNGTGNTNSGDNSRLANVSTFIVEECVKDNILKAYTQRLNATTRDKGLYRRASARSTNKVQSQMDDIETIGVSETLKISHVFRLMNGESYYVTRICGPADRLVPIERSKSTVRLASGDGAFYSNSAAMLGMSHGSLAPMHDVPGSPISPGSRLPSPRPMGDIHSRQRKLRKVRQLTTEKRLGSASTTVDIKEVGVIDDTNENMEFTIGDVSDTPSDLDESLASEEEAISIQAEDSTTTRLVKLKGGSNVAVSSLQEIPAAIGSRVNDDSDNDNGDVDDDSNDNALDDDVNEIHEPLVRPLRHTPVGDIAESRDSSAGLSYRRRKRHTPLSDFRKTRSSVLDFGSKFEMNIPVRSPVPFRLPILPYSLDTMFEIVEKWHCPNCMQIPTDPTVCLICGTIVCCESRCCAVDNKGECNIHAKICGAGTGVFFMVKKFIVLLLHNSRGTMLDSPYLDAHGESGPSLMRGRPQFMNAVRYNEIRMMLVKHEIPTYIARARHPLMESQFGANWSML